LLFSDKRAMDSSEGWVHREEEMEKITYSGLYKKTHERRSLWHHV